MCQMCAGICLLLSDTDTADVLIKTPLGWKLLLTISEYPSDRLSKDEKVALTNHQNPLTLWFQNLLDVNVKRVVRTICPVYHFETPPVNESPSPQPYGHVMGFFTGKLLDISEYRNIPIK